jgi:hypothetical protein
VHERYARLRAQCLPKHEAFKEANRRAVRGRAKPYQEAFLYNAVWNLERKQEIAQRIQYLARDAVQLVSEKRKRIEERLWSIHESDIGDYFTETANGVEQPKRLSEMSPDIRKNIEKIIPDSKGRLIPQLYNRMVASKELRAMLDIGKPSDASASSNLSDAELIAQLSDQAKQLGVEINLSYDFAKGEQASPGLPDEADQAPEPSDIKPLED